MSDSSFDDDLPQELTERGKNLLESVKPGSRMERRTPKVMVDELRYALQAYQQLDLSANESRELLSRSRSNQRKRIAVWGVLNIGTPVPNLDLRPFPQGYEIAARRLAQACSAVMSLNKKPGRPRKATGLWMAGQTKQPVSSRHLNFGEREIKWTVANKLLLVCAVEAIKLKYGLTKDADALFKIAEKGNKGRRSGIIFSEAKRLAPVLSKARKSFMGKQDYKENIQRIAKKWSNNDLI